MSKDTDDLVENILSAQQWLRILLIIGFGILSWLLRFVQVAIALIQALFALITGRDNNNMRKAGTLLSLYQAHIWLYMSYSTDIKPYPFTDLPESGSDLDRELKSPDDDGDDEANDYRDDVRSPGPASTQHGNQTASTATAGTSSSDDDVFSDISFTAGSTAAKKNQEDNAPSQDTDDNSASGKQDDSDPDSKRPT